MAKGVNYYDGSAWTEVAAVEQADGSTATVYRWDGSSWVQIFPSGGSSATILDSFEDQDMAEYSFATSGGATKSGAHSFVTSNVTDGTYAVDLGDPNNETNNVSFVSTSGLDNYFSQGEVMKVDFTISDISDGEASIYYGSQGHVDSSTSRPYGYEFAIRTRSDSTDDIRIVVKDSNGNASELESTSVSWGSTYDGVTLEAVIDWGTDDSHTCEVRDDTGSTIASVSTTDATWTTETGIGMGVFPSNNSGFATFDHFRK